MGMCMYVSEDVPFPLCPFLSLLRRGIRLVVEERESSIPLRSPIMNEGSSEAESEAAADPMTPPDIKLPSKKLRLRHPWPVWLAELEVVVVDALRVWVVA